MCTEHAISAPDLWVSNKPRECLQAETIRQFSNVPILWLVRVNACLPLQTKFSWEPTGKEIGGYHLQHRERL